MITNARNLLTGCHYLQLHTAATRATKMAVGVQGSESSLDDCDSILDAAVDFEMQGSRLEQ